MPFGQGRAHRHRDQLLSGRRHVQPGQPLAGDGLELGPEIAAPLVHQVGLVDDQVLQVTRRGRGGEAIAETLDERLG